MCGSQNELEKLTKDEETTRTTLEETVGRYNTENAIKKALIAEVSTRAWLFQVLKQSCYLSLGRTRGEKRIGSELRKSASSRKQRLCGSRERGTTSSSIGHLPRRRRSSKEDQGVSRGSY